MFSAPLHGDLGPDALGQGPDVLGRTRVYDDAVPDGRHPAVEDERRLPHPGPSGQGSRQCTSIVGGVQALAPATAL
jgi:hypothetical protein